MFQRSAIRRYRYVVACAGLDNGIIDDINDFETVVHACIIDFPTKVKRYVRYGTQSGNLTPRVKCCTRRGMRLWAGCIVRENDEKIFGFLCDLSM